jgi:hypothetical protein
VNCKKYILISQRLFTHSISGSYKKMGIISLDEWYVLQYLDRMMAKAMPGSAGRSEHIS